MKKAEAISILATSVRPREAKDRARYDEAVRMAIEALKCSEQAAEIAPNVSNGDLIYRKAAIDALKGLPTWWADEGGYYGGAQPPMVALLDPEDAVSAIENLPSAQPATNCSEIPNSSDDTISRQAAIDALARMMPRSYTPDGSHPADEEIFRAQEVFADCIEALEILPSAQPDHVADVSKKVDVDDLISRRAVIDAVSEYATFWMSYTDDMSASDIAQEAINSAKDTMIRILKEQPTIQPETATVTIGRTKGGVVMWYECDACGESIDKKDCYCRNCGRKLTLPKPYRGGEK